MNRRLQQFLAAENISQSQFADTLGVARASVSHILAGRNKPGFDFIESMSRNYPDINLEWVITGKGKMYKSAAPKAEKDVEQADLFASIDEENLSVETSNIGKSNHIAKREAISYSSNTTLKSPSLATNPIPSDIIPGNTRTMQSSTSDRNMQAPNTQRNIVRIVVFYDDNTYQELK